MQSAEIFQSARNRINGIFRGTPSSVSKNADLQPLTEGLSYLLKYRDAVSPNDVSTIVRAPGYNIMAPYFGLKLLDHQPTDQQQLLAAILQDFSDGRGYEGAGKSVEQALAGKVNVTPVSAKEISRVATWGPKTIDTRAHQALATIKADGQTPVIIGYGGLLALKAAIDVSDVGDKTYLVLPKRMNPLERGYKITKNENDITLDILSGSDFDTPSPIALVDDATHSGNTFTTVSSLFPRAEIHDTPLFRT